MSIGMVGRQPILNKEGEIFAYELLYRNTQQNQANIIDPTQATCDVVLNTLTNFGLEKLTGKKKAFINVGEELLFDSIIETFPKEHFVLEILEDITMTPELHKRIAELRAQGFHFALDDIIFDKKLLENFKPVFEYVDIIKFDILQTGTEKLEEKLHYFEQYNLAYLAEKVETKKIYEQCKALHFDYYQGYFFGKPDLLSNKKISPSKLLVIKIIKLLKEDASIEKINEEFTKSPHLALELLKYLNSAHLSFQTRITSIPHAITLLGTTQLAQWLTLYLYMDAQENKFALAIMDSALFKAKLMQELASSLQYDKKFQDKAYLTGMLSLIDALLETTHQEIFSKIHLDEDIHNVFQSKKGRLYKLLQISNIVETNDPRTFEVFEKLGIKSQQCAEIIATSYEWVNSRQL